MDVYPMIDEMPDVTAEELMFAMDAGTAAAQLKMPITNPEEIGFKIHTRNDELESFKFTDTPMNRLMFGIKKAFKDEPEKITALSMRLFALIELLQEKKIKRKLKPWTRVAPDDSDTRNLHEDLFKIAAELPLTKNATFEKKKFVSALAKLTPPTNDSWITP